MLTLLLQNGGLVFIDRFDSLAFTPLTWAAREKKISVMNLLIDPGANVNAVDESRIGNTALREAADKAEGQWGNVKSEHGQKILELLRVTHTEADKILSKFPKEKYKKR